VGRPDGKRPFGRPRGVDGRIILKGSLSKWGEESWVGFIWLGKGKVADASECDDKLSCFIKFGTYLD
jgi:hypothetical protein